MSSKKQPFARKRFGQNYLSDPSVASEIVESARLTPEDHVIEIGPGRGAITGMLLASGAHLTAIEVDRDLASSLRKKYESHSRFALIEGDVLKIDWDGFLNENRKYKLVANLPYNISTPLFFQFIRYRNQFDSFVVMVQKEVAERITHDGTGKTKKDYGILSVIATLCFQCDWICHVPPSAFIPQPKVNSAVIRLRPLASLFDSEEEEMAFFQFVKEAFNQRRKLFISFLRRSKPGIHDALNSEELAKYSTVRPEDLSPTELLHLFRLNRARQLETQGGVPSPEDDL